MSLTNTLTNHHLQNDAEQCIVSTACTERFSPFAIYFKHWYFCWPFFIWMVMKLVIGLLVYQIEEKRKANRDALKAMKLALCHKYEVNNNLPSGRIRSHWDDVKQVNTIRIGNGTFLKREICFIGLSVSCVNWFFFSRLRFFSGSFRQVNSRYTLIFIECNSFGCWFCRYFSMRTSSESVTFHLLYVLHTLAQHHTAHTHTHQPICAFVFLSSTRFFIYLFTTFFHFFFR